MQDGRAQCRRRKAGERHGHFNAGDYERGYADGYSRGYDAGFAFGCRHHR
jgi:hypothetical protein